MLPEFGDSTVSPICSKKKGFLTKNNDEFCFYGILENLLCNLLGLSDSRRIFVENNLTLIVPQICYLWHFYATNSKLYFVIQKLDIELLIEEI